MDKKQPEAQERKFWKRLCALNRFSFFYMGGGVARASDKSGNWIEVHSAQEIVDDAECEVSTQHARITDLEAQLESIGAGGVSGPLIGQPQAMPDLSQLTERGAVAWAGVDAQGLRDGGASPSANAGEPSAHIKEPYTLAEIKAKIASNDYSAEMLLQHAMLLLDSASLSANAGQAGEYPALVCDYCGALTPEPWHSSGMLHGKMSKHIHACDACAARVAAKAQAAKQQGQLI